MKRVLKLTFLSASLIGSFYACKPGKEVTTAAATTAVVINKSGCDTLTVTYTSNIKPLMDAHCVSCHNSKEQALWINLSTYELVKEEASRAWFLGSIEHEERFSPMPKYAKPKNGNPETSAARKTADLKFSDSTIRVIKCWIENGMPL